MSLVSDFPVRNPLPALPSLPLADWIGRLRRARWLSELYAVSVDRMWFAAAVLLGLIVAGWIVSAPQPAPAPPPGPVETILTL